jgi:uncharacterized membrane protein YqhA
MLKLLASSRYLIIFAVIGAFVAATILLIYDIYDTFQLVMLLDDSFENPAKAGKLLMIEAIQLVDLYLVAVVMYLIALGLFELFIDDRLDLPDWLEIHGINDLKEILISVVMVVMAVYFLSVVLSWEKGDTSILYLGGGIAVMIIALTYFISQHSKKDKPAGSK